MDAATGACLADVGSNVRCFRTGNGTELGNEAFSKLCNRLAIRDGHTGVVGPTHNGVVDRGFGLIQ